MSPRLAVGGAALPGEVIRLPGAGRRPGGRPTRAAVLLGVLRDADGRAVSDERLRRALARAGFRTAGAEGVRIALGVVRARLPDLGMRLVWSEAGEGWAVEEL